MAVTMEPDQRELAYTVGVVEADPSVRAGLVSMIGSITQAVDFSSLEAFTGSHVPGTPTVLVLGPSLVDSNVLPAYAEFSTQHPEVKAIAVMTDLSPKLMQLAMRAGVDDVISSEDEQAQLVEAITGAARGLAAIAPLLGGGGPTESAPEPEQASTLGRVITVVSGKAGAGKSITAVNLAVTLAKRTDKPVLLIDADLQLGDVAVMLKLMARHTVMDAIANIARLDSALLKSYLVQHQESGVMVLPAPLEPVFADQVTPADMQQILQLARQIGMYVVVDTFTYYNELFFSILEESDDVLLVAGMDIPNIKDVKIFLQTLRQLDFPMERLRLTINRANSKVKLDIGEVEKTLQLSAAVLIPSDIEIPRSVNKGVPAVIANPRSELSAAFDQMAELYLATPGTSPAAAAKKSRFF